MTPSAKHAPGPIEQRGRYKHLGPHKHWGRLRQKDEHQRQEYLLGRKQFEGPPQWCVLDQNQSLVFCITRPAGLIEDHGSLGAEALATASHAVPETAITSSEVACCPGAAGPTTIREVIVNDLGMKACGEFLSSGGTVQSSFIRLVTIVVTSATGSACKTDWSPNRRTIFGSSDSGTLNGCAARPQSSLAQRTKTLRPFALSCNCSRIRAFSELMLKLHSAAWHGTRWLFPATDLPVASVRGNLASRCPTANHFGWW